MEADRPTPDKSPMSTRWRVKAEPAVLWRCWDGEYVAYCAATGSTHLLAGLAAEIFEQVMARPSDGDALCAGIAGGFDADEAEKLREAVPQVLANLAKAEIIEPAPE